MRSDDVSELDELDELDDQDGPGASVTSSLLGLDGEMSSADLSSGGRLIQAGFAIRYRGELAVFSTLISWPEMEWSERAAQVHGLSRADLACAPTPAQADELCERWLLAHGATAGRRSLVSVGINVVGFDHPFFRQALPKTMSLVSRRGVDLNAAFFTLGGWDPQASAQPRDWLGWKRSMKRAADRQLAAAGVAGRPHDAGWDAAQALVGFEWLQSELVGAVRPSRSVALYGQDPQLAALFGSGLLTRLESCLDAAQVRQVAAALAPAVEATGLSAGALCGRRRPDLGGSSVLDLLQASRVEDALAALSALGASR